MHPFRFAVQVSSFANAAEIRAVARMLEGLGYSTLSLPDHLDQQWSPAVALTIAAEATTTLNMGVLMYGNDYRHPAILAKEAATLDLATSGRFELGLGAGWMMSDYSKAGLDFDRPGIRIARLAESIAVVRGLLSAAPFGFEGEHYQISEMTGYPAPHTAGGPKLVVGGGGRKVLTLAAQQADIVAFNTSLHEGMIGGEAVKGAMAGAFTERVEWVRRAAGERFDELELQINTFMARVTDDAETLVGQIAPGFGITAAQATSSPMVLVGTTASIGEQLLERRETYGFSYIVIHQAEAEAFAPVVAALAGK